MAENRTIDPFMIFLPAVKQPCGTKIFIRRRKRVRQGRVIGPAQPYEIEAIKAQHPDIAAAAGLMSAPPPPAEPKAMDAEPVEAPKPQPKKRGRPPKKATTATE